ncbi:MAG: Do family serine endopeptidase [Rickettsiales bacterium]|nr:Do family serine endopeptidase [Rickettsiales bacterium]
MNYRINKKIVAISIFLILSLFNKTTTAKSNNPKKVTNSENQKNLISYDFADKVEKLLPTVVNISTVQSVNLNQQTLEKLGLKNIFSEKALEELRQNIEKQLTNSEKLSSIGSGFIISKDGLIVTNQHVIDNASKININLSDGSKYEAKILGFDKKTDLALLKINTKKELPFVKFGDSNKSRIGDPVIVIGNPYGLGGSVSSGIISYLGRDINRQQSDEFIQTDAAINKGNSGGPMFSINGEVIGVSTIIFSPSGGSVGIGFATPSNVVEKIIKQLQEKGNITRGWIGITIQEVDENIATSLEMKNPQGAIVVNVADNSPASDSGIIAGDVILKFNNQEIKQAKTLPKLVSQYPIDKEADIKLLSNGNIKNIKIKISKMTEEPIKNNKKTDNSNKIIGMSLLKVSTEKNSSKENQIEGLLVIDVENISIAKKNGIIANDIIILANQKQVKATDDLRKIIEESKNGGKKITLLIKRMQQNIILNLSLEE